jgi:hypothetical protein
MGASEVLGGSSGRTTNGLSKPGLMISFHLYAIVHINERVVGHPVGLWVGHVDA